MPESKQRGWTWPGVAALTVVLLFIGFILWTYPGFAEGALSVLVLIALLCWFA